MGFNNHIIVYPLAFSLFMFALILSKHLHGNRLFNDRGVASNKLMLFVFHIAGICLFGILPLVYSQNSFIEILAGDGTAPPASVLFSCMLIILAVAVAPFTAKRKFQQIRSHYFTGKQLTHGFIISYFMLRIPFLFAYELWFRGYLLKECTEHWRMSVAIVVNIVLYVLAHCVHGKSEMRGCIAFGLLLCLQCIWAGAAWPAIGVHTGLAVSHEIHLVRKIYNPPVSIV